MSITKKEFGTYESGEKVYIYTLDNNKGLSAEIISLGGIIKSLFVTDKNGVKHDVVLGRDTLKDYSDNAGYLGALIGRHANRIQNSTFVLDGTTYHVGQNEGSNSLHGGLTGFDKKVWTVVEKDGNEPSLELSLFSPDNEEGFPGNLKVKVIYTLTADNSLKIEYSAVSDKDTVLNMTNHSYFNLGGHDSGSVEDHILQMNSSFYTPNNSDCIPTGEISSVSGTPFDFRAPKPIGQDIHSDFEQTKMFGGYDHNFAISGRGMRMFAVVSSPKTNITMQVFSDQSGVQLYTANALDDGIYKNGAHYSTHQALCLETQCFPNSMEFSHFPSPILKKGDTYHTVTEYKFIV